MKKSDLILASVKGVVPSPNGMIVFLWTDEKAFVIYVDLSIGSAISLHLNNAEKERPLTHDLINHILTGFNISVEKVIINDVSNNIFFASLILKMSNELGVKLLEIDCRPSDAILIALQSNRPIFVHRKVLDAVEDMTEIIEHLLKG
ncbi:MAG: hypothetical protein A2007_00275 [Verrucomicrobia bacterium GWC2_42_7]|nr:MAG: hypothetical protein A2007_00275 [Verrucomicrobia bacterium GWC2_42_7]